MLIVHVTAGIPGGGANSEFWRHQNFVSALNRHGVRAYVVPIAQFVQPSQQVAELLSSASIIFIQRSAMGQVIDTALWYMENTDAAVIFDFDDDYMHLNKNNPAWRHWTQDLVPDNGKFTHVNMPTLDQLRLAARLFNGFSVPTEKLKTQWESYCPVYVIPNYPTLSYYTPGTQKSMEEIVFGYGGSYSHQKSMIDSGFLEGLARVVWKMPNLQVEMATTESPVFNALNVPKARKKRLDWVDYEKWPAYLNRWHLTAAVSYDEHDAYRSPLHILEPGLAETPVLASDAEPYNQYREYLPVMVKNTPRAWERAIWHVVHNLEHYQLVAHNITRPWAESWSIDANIGKIIDTYKAIENSAVV